MKRIITSIFTLGAFALASQAQARFTSNIETFDLGQVEWKYPATAQYMVTNTGDQPLVLTDVQPDCACTTLRWTQQAIAPGAKGSIEVTFDAQALGSFKKSIAVYTNAQPHLVRLYLSGKVVTKITDFTRTHPYVFGPIRTDINTLDFPDVNRGEHPVIRMSVVNEGEKPYEPVLMHLPSYLDMEVKPSVLQTGERGEITLTLNSEKLLGLGLTQSSVYLAKFSGDKVSDETEIPISAVLLPDFSGLTATEKANLPKIEISQTEIDMSTVLQKKKKAKCDLLITNTGKRTLDINQLQVFHPAVGVSMKKNALQPGESTRLRVTVDKRNIGKHRRHLRLLMITNDPTQPKVEIDIKAK